MLLLLLLLLLPKVAVPRHQSIIAVSTLFASFLLFATTLCLTRDGGREKEKKLFRQNRTTAGYRATASPVLRPPPKQFPSNFSNFGAVVLAQAVVDQCCCCWKSLAG